MAQFDPKEAEAILIEAARREARAATGETGVSRERLAAMAAELDIAPETLHAVLSEREAATGEAALRQAFIRERRGTISAHVVPYVSVCALLFLIWAITGGGHPWFLYPIAGWGIGVASHIAAAYPTSGAAFETAFAAYRKKAVRQERDRVRRETKRAAKETQTEAVEDTVIAEARDWNADTDPVQQTLRAGLKK